jgi:hypothetical protein
MAKWPNGHSHCAVRPLASTLKSADRGIQTSGMAGWSIDVPIMGCNTLITPNKHQEKPWIA